MLIIFDGYLVDRYEDILLYLISYIYVLPHWSLLIFVTQGHRGKLWKAHKTQVTCSFVTGDSVVIGYKSGILERLMLFKSKDGVKFTTLWNTWRCKEYYHIGIGNATLSVNTVCFANDHIYGLMFDTASQLFLEPGSCGRHQPRLPPCSSSTVQTAIEVSNSLKDVLSLNRIKGTITFYYNVILKSN